MKFSKSSWILLALGAVVIIAFVSGMYLSQQAQQQENLGKQLFETQKKLGLVKIDDLTSQKDQLTQDKIQYTAQIAADKAQLSASLDDIAATDMILKSAHQFDIQITSINSNGKSDNTLAGNKFTVLPFSIQAEGSTKNITEFVSNLKTVFPTSMVEVCQLSLGIPAPTPEAILTQSQSVITTAAINMSIYELKGELNVE